VQSIAKWDWTKHPRGKGGKFTEKASVTVNGRDIEVVKPRRAALSGEKLVSIDTAAFDTAFQRETGFYLSEGGGPNAIHDRYTRFGDFIAEHDSIESSEVTINANGKVGFTNGRHRYAWLRDHGVANIPVSMDEESIAHAKRHGYLSTVKHAWDESQHPRDAEGQFTGGGRGLTADEQVTLQTWQHHHSNMQPEHREAMRPILDQTGPGGALAHLRPPTGTVLYRGTNRDTVGDGPASFSTNPEYVSLFGENVFKIVLYEEDKALALKPTGLVTGVDEGEVIVQVNARIRSRAKMVAQKQEHEYGNTQIAISPHSSAAATLNAARAEIADNDLMAAGKDVDPNHITVRYGLLNDDLDALRSFLAAQTSFEAYIGPVELFPVSEHSDGAQPVVAQIISPDLRAIEAEIGKHADFKEKSFPVYKPHCTLAYCKPEAAEKYHDLFLHGSFVVQGITISHQSGVKETIPFGMAQKKQWDEGKRRRQPSGTSHGGEFATTLFAPSDAVKSVLNGEKVNIAREDVRAFLDEARKVPEGLDPPNLTHVHVEGMRIFGGEGLGIARDEMPQIPRKHRAQFLQEMEEAGVKIVEESVDPLTLKPTQKEVSAKQVGEMLDRFDRGEDDRGFPPLLVSDEDRVLDGHHHWGTMAAFAVDVPEATVPIYRLMIGTEEALAYMHAYDKKYGIVRKAMGQKWDASKHPRDEQGQFSESFHGTTTTTIESIKAHGLLASKNVDVRGDRPKSIFVTTSERRAHYYGLYHGAEKITVGPSRGFYEGSYAIVKVEIPVEHWDKYALEDEEDDEGSYRFEQDIPVEWIKSIATVGKEGAIKKIEHFDGKGWSTVYESKTAKSDVRVVYVPVQLTAQKWDESQHPRDDDGQFAKAAIQRGQAHTVSEDEFLKYHNTGYIESNAYERYEAGELDFIHREDFQTLLETREVNGQTVEIRLQAEPRVYNKRTVAASDAERERLYEEYEQEAKRLGTSPMMAGIDLGRDSEAYEALNVFAQRWLNSGEEWVRDAHGNLVPLTPEEVQAQGLPTVSYTVGAFVGDKAIGYADDEFGASGVYLARAYQRHGIGLTLFKTYLEKSGKLAKGTQIGQMTPAGQALVRALHRQLVKEAKKWDEAKHPRNEEGQFAANRLAQLKKILPTTTNPRETSFLLPDGTRLRAVSEAGEYQPHERAIGRAGFTMTGLLSLGVARVVPHVGIEIGKPLTQTQAQMLADDWIEYQDSIVVEAVDITAQDREIIVSKEFHEPNEGLLYAFSKHAFQRVKKADPTGRYVTPFVSFDKQGDEQLRMIASLNSSRLATWGFTAEAEVLGMARYKLTAVLDGRTSKFCRLVDGKIFSVPDARRKVIEVLNVQNPEDLRVVQPWPKQTKQALAEFAAMTPAELTERGLHIPPYHPHCRTICRAIQTSIGEVKETVPTIPAGTEAFQPVTQADLKELGVEATQEQVDLWNAHIGMTPVELLSKLSNMPPREVMTKGKGVGSNPITFDAGTIGFNVRGADPRGVEFKLGAILDPFTGIYYLSQAQLIAGTPKAELAFMKNLFSSLIEMGIKSSATSIAVGVAGNAPYYARLGFLPDELEWDGLRKFALTEIEGSLIDVMASFAPEDRLLIIHLLQDKSVGALSALVELPFRYKGKTIGEWLFGETTGTWALDLLDEMMVAQAKAYLS
jgi:2'-5' RNA ligase/GNAT superfamily N-acetyltransferase